MKVGLCIEMVLTSLPFEERIRKASQIGFKNVELWFAELPPAELAAAARRHGVAITNTVVGSPDGSGRISLTDPRNRERWFECAKREIEFAKQAGVPSTIVCTGNCVQGAAEQEMEKSVVDGLKATAKMAEAAGVTLLLEPLNTTHDHPGYWLTSSDKGAEICRKVGSPRMKLLFDCYHMQIMEGDLTGHIRRNLDVIGHIHAAGHPGRHELWLGETNYAFLARQLDEMGYKGVFALEYSPSMDDETSLRRTLEYLSTGRTE